MMYLSQIILSFDECMKYRIRNDYDIHQLIVSLFPYGNERYLYYVDRSVSSYLKILLQSKQEPENLLFGLMSVKSISDSFFKQDRYRFKVRVSPTKRKEGKASSVLYGEEVGKWFSTRTQNLGFTVVEESLESVGRGVMKMRGSNGNLITIHYEDLSGILDVTDQDKFMHNAIEKGIGPSKGFGCGLLQIKPIKNN